MAILKRIIKHGGRSKTLSSTNRASISNGPRGLTRIDFRPEHAVLGPDERYNYVVLLQHADIYRAIHTMRVSEVGKRLTPEEWSKFVELSRKALGVDE